MNFIYLVLAQLLLMIIRNIIDIGIWFTWQLTLECMVSVCIDAVHTAHIDQHDCWIDNYDRVGFLCLNWTFPNLIYFMRFFSHPSLLVVSSFPHVHVCTSCTNVNSMIMIDSTVTAMVCAEQP